eukprot:4282061-Amphidinium_carterae.1
MVRRVGCRRRVAFSFAIVALSGFAALGYHSCFSSTSAACYLKRKDENLQFNGTAERTTVQRLHHNISIVMVINYSDDRLDFALTAVRAAANLHQEYWVDILTTRLARKRIVQRLRPCRPSNVRLWLVREDTPAQQLFEKRYKHASVNPPAFERFCILRHIWVHAWMRRAYRRRGVRVAIHLDADILTVKPLATMVPKTISFWAYSDES